MIYHVSTSRCAYVCLWGVGGLGGGGGHLIAQGLAEVLSQVDVLQGPLVQGVQLLEPVQQHDGLLPYQLLGVGQQLLGPRQHGVDEVRPDNLARRSQGRARCRMVICEKVWL